MSRRYAALFLLLVLVGPSFPAAHQEPVQLQAAQGGALALDGGLCALAFTADAKDIACVSLLPEGTPGAVRVRHSTRDWQRVGTLPATKGMVNALAFTQDGKTLGIGGSASADPADTRRGEGVVRLWDAAAGKEWASLKAHKSPVTSLKFSPDGRVLASTTATGGRRFSWQAELKLWDLSALKQLATIPGHGQYDVLEFAPDGKILAWATQGVYAEKRLRWEPEIKLVNVATGTELAVLKGHTDELKCMAFSPDGRTLASGGGSSPSLPVPDGTTVMLGRKALMEKPGQLRLWDVATGKERADLQGHNGCVLSVAFSPDGKMLASGGAGTPVEKGKLWYWSGEVKLWDLATGKEQVAIGGHPFPNGTVEYVAFSPDGTTLASAGGNMVKLWDTATGRELAEVRGDSSETYFWVGFQGDRMLLLSRHLLIDDGIGVLRGLKIWDAPLVK